VAAALALVLGALGGCKKEAPPSQPVQSSSAAGAAADAGARFPLTREQVDRFVKYQTRLVERYDQVLKQREHEKAAPIARLPDGGMADPVKVSLQLFEGKAKAEETARGEAGLSMQEVRGIEPVVAEVINERSNARDENVEAAVKQYEAMRDKLPEDQRKPVEEQLADLRSDHEYRFKNVEQRQKFGDAAVDAVLSRESDLARLRTEWVKRIGALSR
jgi:acyl-CoA reductase-like NAD-dependent aldehyde dehydrogenase